MVPTVYQRLINAVHILTEDLRIAGRESDVTAVWKPYIAEALALPAQHRFCINVILYYIISYLLLLHISIITNLMES